MPSPTWLDYARISEAAYDVRADRVAGGWSRIWFGQIGKGFQGARYRRSIGGSTDEICAFMGTHSLEGAVADLGFAGGAEMLAIITAMSPTLAVLAATGRSGLSSQLNFAIEMLGQAQSFIGRTGGTLYITGHSLGGGLAQIVSAALGVRATTISAPVVSQLPGVAACFAHTKPAIANLRVENDPINMTEVFGKRLGKTDRLMTARGAKTAHFIAGTVYDLSPYGCATKLGEARPI
jgi:hypothetical protein